MQKLIVGSLTLFCAIAISAVAAYFSVVGLAALFSAALVPEGRRYRPIYSYRNQPKPGEPELQAHIGHCELLFETGLQSAEGNYFNGGGRFTHGTMNLKRDVPDAA